MNPLTLAYIGDSVFSDAIRRYLISQGMQNVNHLTKESIQYVRAEAQAIIVRSLMDEGMLTETECAIVKRGRNTHSHVPKNAKIIDYRYATGFEALLGFLSLTGQSERLQALTIQSIEIINAHIKKTA